MKYILLFISILILKLNLFGQNIDSLKHTLKKAKNDTNHVNVLSNLAWNIGPNNPDTAIIISNQALQLSRKIKWETGEAKIELRIGVYYCFKRDFQSALIHLNKALIMSKKLIMSKDTLISKSGQNTKIKALINIGNIYNDQSNYPKALEYYLKSLKIAEVVIDKKGIGRILMSIGSIYKSESNFVKANEYYLKSLEIAEKFEDNIGIESNLGNIATIYQLQANYEKALEYYFKVLSIAEKTADKKVIGQTLGNIAGVYDYQSNSKKALEYYTKSLKNLEEAGDKQTMAYYLANIGIFYIRIGKYKDAEITLKKALISAKESGSENAELNIHNFSTILYEKTHKPALAFEHYKKYITLRDSIFSKENSKKIIRSEMNYEYEKKLAIDNAVHQSELKQQKTIADEKSKKQQIITWSIVFSLILVSLFSLFAYRSLKITRKQKLVIEEQKHLVEEKHKEITDSINYAERIQRSFLATKEILEGNLKEYFVLFKPKDVVSGDFYWASILNNGNFALVTADSTGHGVPGAIMSLLNITSLEKAVEHLNNPSEILNHTRTTIITRLKKDGSEHGGKDGMDASLIVFDFNLNRLQIAAANNPVWIVRNSTLIEIKPDKMPIGRHDKDSTHFTQQTIDIQHGDVIYTITDGYPDQFGGEKGKKFMSKNLKELLLANSHLPMDEQKVLLDNTFKNWIGDLEQVDDVTVIGIRV